MEKPISNWLKLFIFFPWWKKKQKNQRLQNKFLKTTSRFRSKPQAVQPSASTRGVLPLRLSLFSTNFFWWRSSGRCYPDIILSIYILFRNNIQISRGSFGLFKISYIFKTRCFGRRKQFGEVEEERRAARIAWEQQGFRKCRNFKASLEFLFLLAHRNFIF